MVKILIVDDEKDVCNFVRNFFGKRGFEVYMALSGEDALKIVEKEDPLVILQDVKMPGMDGIETLKRLKKKRPNNRIIMVTGMDDVAIMEEAKKNGADGYITKPLVLDELVRAVASVVPKLRPNN